MRGSEEMNGRKGEGIERRHCGASRVNFIVFSDQELRIVSSPRLPFNPVPKS